jgi:urea transport system ATP-binding protein
MSAEPLQVESIRVCYGESEAIGNLSFQVQQGEILAVMGLNGMGKTTLMKALIGLLSVRGGNIKVTGRDVTKSKPFERVRAGLAYVPQGRLLFPTLTVEENIQTGLPRSKREVPAQLYEFFPAIGKMRGRRAGNLSGGQQQQVAIARALASNPRVLLLVEPTEGLQPSIIKELAVELRRIRDERGVTVVVSEQVLSFALAAADRVLVMARGALIHEGVRGELDETRLGQLLAL